MHDNLCEELWDYDYKSAVSARNYISDKEPGSSTAGQEISGSQSDGDYTWPRRSFSRGSSMFTHDGCASSGSSCYLGASSSFSTAGSCTSLLDGELGLIGEMENGFPGGQGNEGPMNIMEAESATAHDGESSVHYDLAMLKNLKKTACNLVLIAGVYTAAVGIACEQTVNTCNKHDTRDGKKIENVIKDLKKNEGRSQHGGNGTTGETGNGERGAQNPTTAHANIGNRCVQGSDNDFDDDFDDFSGSGGFQDGFVNISSEEGDEEFIMV